jgi:hypothetical protein
MQLKEYNDIISFSLTSIVIPYVCPQCSHVLFCSEHCQERALASYHQYECKHIHVLKTLGIAFLGTLIIHCFYI